MKKTLLSLGLLTLAFQGFAQYGPRFEEVNLINSSTPPDFVIENIHTASPTIAWGTVYERTATTSSTASGFRALPAGGGQAAGTTFDYFPIASVRNPTFLTSNIEGITDMIAVASTFNATGPGGEVVRTTDGGQNWTRVTSATDFAAPDGFNNLVHMFNANDGVAFGDPNGGPYEVLTTNNGGVTWTRNTSANLVPVVAGVNEAGLTRAFTARGNTIWVAAGIQATTTAPGGISRIFKNTNKGLGAWTAVTVPNFAGPATDLAFRDDLNGIILNTVVAGGAITGVTRSVTTDGGGTWTTTNLSAPDTTATGSFYFTGVDASQGKFISYGRRLFASNTLKDFGYSYSTDGTTWTDVQKNTPFTALDLQDSDGQGFGGYVTDATDGTGGIIKTSTSTPGSGSWQYALGTRKNNVAVQQSLSVYPNPSIGGNFTLRLTSGVKAGTQVVVYDAVGRQVYNRALNATAVNAQSTTIDLSQQKTGIYTLELRTNEGTAQQKLVVE